MKIDKTVFIVAGKAIRFAWVTDRASFIFIVILNVLSSAGVYLQLLCFSFIINEIITIGYSKGDTNGLVKLALYLGGVFVFQAVVKNLLSYYNAKFKLSQGLHLLLNKIEKQSTLDISTTESASYQGLLRSIQEWGNSSVLDVQDFVFNSASFFAGTIFSFTILYTLSPLLVIYSILAALPVYFFYKKYSMEVFRIRHFSVDDYRLIANRVSYFEEIHKAIDVILLKLAPWLTAQIKERREAFNKKILNAERRKSLSYGVLSVWYLLFLFMAIYTMLSQAVTGTLAVGGLVLAFNTYSHLYQTINNYVEAISISAEAARYAERWFKLLELEPMIRSKPGAVRLDCSTSPLIEFRNVHFRYPGDGNDRYILQDLSFSVRPNEKLAIIGLNGAGKTTLIKLICRVYDPTEGAILVNGIDLRDINLDDWYDTIGVLFQDFPVYNFTLRESIYAGRINEGVDESKIINAAKAAGADEFIVNYDSFVWKGFQNGIDLSKGQHQRMAVARMFYRNAPVTILDEPTSFIDTKTEDKIFNSIIENNITKGTVVLITHRLSNMRGIDTILMMEHGRIVEQGNNEELLKENGKYAQIYFAQMKRYTS